MIERTLTVVKEKKERLKERTFTLKATQKFVGIGNKSEGQHPHFSLRLSTGEAVFMGDLFFKVLSSCSETRSVCVAMSLVKESSRFDLNDIRKKGQMLIIGDIAEIVLRKIRLNGQPYFQISLERRIPWYFPQNASKYVTA